MTELVQSVKGIQMDRAAYQQWRYQDGGSNTEDLKRVRKVLPIAIRDCLTETQKAYLTAYLDEEMTMREIGERYGVDKSSVSRTIKRGLDKLYDHLRFASPYFAQEPLRQTLYLRRKKGVHMRKRTGKFKRTN